MSLAIVEMLFVQDQDICKSVCFSLCLHSGCCSSNHHILVLSGKVTRTRTLFLPRVAPFKEISLKIIVFKTFYFHPIDYHYLQANGGKGSFCSYVLLFFFLFCLFFLFFFLLLHPFIIFLLFLLTWALCCPPKKQRSVVKEEGETGYGLSISSVCYGPHVIGVGN